MVNENLYLLERFTHCYCLVFNVDYFKVRQNIDTLDTFNCTFLASEILNINDRLIAEYFRINKYYMRGKFVETKLRSDIDDDLFLGMTKVRNLWKLIIKSEVTV